MSTDDEPDLWRRDLTGLVELWIEVGLPEEKWLRKACGRARQVVVLAYGAAKAEQWWKRNEPDLRRLDNLTVLALPAAAGPSLAAMAARSMRIDVTIQESQIWLGSGLAQASLQLQVLKPPARPPDPPSAWARPRPGRSGRLLASGVQLPGSPSADAAQPAQPPDVATHHGDSVAGGRVPGALGRLEHALAQPRGDGASSCWRR